MNASPDTGTGSANVPQSTDGLPEQAARAMARLCAAPASLLESLPDNPERATDVAASLGINPQLAWQVFKMAGSAEPFAAVQYLPTSNQLARVIEAAKAAGAKAAAVRVAAAASGALDEFIASNAKDRREFESLFGSLAAGGAEQVDTKNRRSLYRGNSHYYGIQASTLYGCMIQHPSDREGVLESLTVSGYMGLHTLRPDVSMTIVRQSEMFMDEPGVRRPSDPIRPHGVTPQLLDGLGSGRRVQVEPAGVEDGKVLARVVFPGVGRGSAVSFFTTQEFEEPSPKDANSFRDRQPFLSMRTMVPAERMVLDVLVPSDWHTPGAASVTVYARRHHPERVLEYRSVDIVSRNDDATCARATTDLPTASDVPGAREAVRRLLREKGWDGTAFDIYRCRVTYPVLYSNVLMRVAKRGPAGAKP